MAEKNEESLAHHYRVLSNDVAAKRAADPYNNNLAATGGLDLHAKTEDRRKEGDTEEPMYKIRKVAVIDSRR